MSSAAGKPPGRPEHLTPGQARAIFAFYHRDEATPAVLAKAYRTSRRTVHRIASRQGYARHTRDLWPLYVKDQPGSRQVAAGRREPLKRVS